MAVVRANFRPEFLNRVDEVILFHRLKREQMETIVDIQLERLKKLLADRKIALELDDDARRMAGRQGLRPGLWRAAAEARHPEAAAGPAGGEDPARRDPRRRPREDHRRHRPPALPPQARRRKRSRARKRAAAGGGGGRGAPPALSPCGRGWPSALAEGRERGFLLTSIVCPCPAPAIVASPLGKDQP